MKIDALFDVSGKVAVITGGSGILCGELAKALAERGVKVGILGRTPEKIAAMVAEIQAKGGEALGLVADVLNQTELETARQKVVDTWGRIDIN